MLRNKVVNLTRKQVISLKRKIVVRLRGISIMSELTGKQASLLPEGAALSNYLKFSLNFSQNLCKFYQKADFVSKQQIIGSIFPESLIFIDKSYRTTKVNGAIELICTVNKAFMSMENKKASKNAGLSTLAPPAGLEPATL